MDLSLDDLLNDLQEAQEKKSKTKLSERNVVELVNKLKNLGLLGDDLLYTTNGKEYVTTERVQAEVRAAVRAAGGRVPLVDLPGQLGLDLSHCERAADVVVSASSGTITIAQGELFSAAYFDSLAAEVDDGLQEAGVVAVGDLARRYGLTAEMIGGVLAERVGPIIRGQLEAGVIYTQAYLTRIKAQLRGALRGAVSPVSMPALSKELGIAGLASLSALVPSLVDELAAEGSIAGKLTSGGATWVPVSYVRSQQDAVRAFFQQNGYIGYDTVTRYGIPSARPFLAEHFPDGIALDSAYLSPAVVDQVEAAVEEALAAGGWCDITPHAPSILSAGDTAALLSRCQAVTGAVAATGGAAHVLAGTCVVAAAMLQAIQDKLLEEARQAADEAHKRQKKAGGGGDPAVSVKVVAAEGGGSSKKAAASAAADSDEEDWDMGGKKGKKGARGKKAKGGGGGKPAKSSGGKAAGAQDAEGSGAGAGVSVLSLASLARRVVQLHPDTDGAGTEGGLPVAIARELRPALVAEYERVLHAIFTAGAERRRRLRDAASSALDSAYERLLLYSHGAELFADDEAALPMLHRHLLRSVAAECVDALLRCLAVDSTAGIEEAEEGGQGGGQLSPLVDAAAGPLSAAQRAAIMKQLPPDVRPAISAAADKLSGSSLELFQTEFLAAVEAAGMRMRKLDKRSERALVFAQRKLWEVQAAAATDASTLLMLVLPLLIARQHGRVVSLPGRALSAAIDVLQGGQLPQEALQLLSDFHAAVVEQLKLQSGSGGGDEGASGEVEAKLAAMLPRVHDLAATGGEGGGGAEA
ncbi:hypothetical protein D9Q98_001094 [Chlorella vulgaris]|uniref:E3 UFM1-protein ligase 1 homolog n=1 Tax=Chlorella vulgaris TaxID=3077 RepID=A0A9D4TZJ4_CHLVU|nr:hypothetical protein D9Q98_001094 [Chlorella vulgaris]